jgi:hypothetical protein
MVVRLVVSGRLEASKATLAEAGTLVCEARRQPGHDAYLENPEGALDVLACTLKRLCEQKRIECRRCVVG